MIISEIINENMPFTERGTILTTEERTAVVYAHLRGLTYEQGHTNFSYRFQKTGSTTVAINRLVIKFKPSVNVADGQHPGRPPNGLVGNRWTARSADWAHPPRFLRQDV